MKPALQIALGVVIVAAAVPVAVLGWKRVAQPSAAPSSGTSHRARGDQAFAEGRYGDALIAYQHARELAPTDPELQRAFIAARLGVAASEPGRIADGETETLRYEAGYLLDADSAHSALWLTALGNVFARGGQPEEARVRLEEALRTDPASPVARTALGLLYAREKDGAARAKAELEKVIEAKPDHVPALLPLAQLVLADGNVVRAQEHLEKVLRVREDASARGLLGEVRLRQGQLEPAIAELQRAVTLDPRHIEAQRSLGRALMKAKRPMEALAPLQIAAQASADLDTLLALGATLSALGRSDQALATFNQVLTADSMAPGALFGAGKALEDVGRAKDALGYYQRLMALRPAGTDVNPELAAVQKAAKARLDALTGGGQPAPADAPPAPR